MAKYKTGDQRFLVEHIDAERAQGIARKNGWEGGDEGFLDYCDHGMAAAIYTEHATFDEALARARKNMAGPQSLFGADLIKRQVLEPAHDDSGNLVRGCKPEWETVETWEVDSDGDCIAVSL